MPNIMLGGIAIAPHAGAPEMVEEPIGGSTLLRLSDGSGVKMTHWQKQSGTISGSGLLPPGLDGLDYTQPLELRTNQVSSIRGAGPEFILTSIPRSDVDPWAFALVGNQWISTACSYLDGVVAVNAVSGATDYQVCWLPVYSVFASRPSRSQSTAHGWSISWEEA